MKKGFKKFAALFLCGVLLMGFAACGSSEKGDGDSTTKKPGQSSQASIDGLPSGFPSEIPLYSGAEVLDADNYNTNRYTVLYSVSAAFDKVLAFYAAELGLDKSEAGESQAYYEAIELGDVYIYGLTIEDTGSGVNVYMTLRDDGQNDGGDDNDDGDDNGDSNAVRYSNAQEVTLDDSYPDDVVPIYGDAKVIGCSMVPGTRSGFIDLILPADAFDSAVDFYTGALGLTPRIISTVAQKGAEFKGESGGIKFVLLISHLQGGAHDPLVQITVNEQ